MSVSADRLPTEPDDEDGCAGEELRTALLDERSAYEAMRSLVPDLALPVATRRPLTPAQQAAVDRHHELRAVLEGLRSAHRTPVLTLVRDQ
jgi:chromatin segregation and condensation protein Rec8/ScpA/Scc1 (kleisin family)